MQRSNEVGKPANKQAQIHALDVLCTMLWHSMALLQYDYARPMRALCAQNQKANKKALAHACSGQPNLVSWVTNTHKYMR